VAKFKCLGETVIYQNYIHSEINSVLNRRNACYHSVHIFYLLPATIKMKIRKTIIVSVLYGHETWSFTSLGEREVYAEENTVQSQIIRMMYEKIKYENNSNFT
jgi:hypothetical protein